MHSQRGHGIATSAVVFIARVDLLAVCAVTPGTRVPGHARALARVWARVFAVRVGAAPTIVVLARVNGVAVLRNTMPMSSPWWWWW